MNFKKIIIWGHKYHSHTHSYVHGGFFRAFKSLGFEVIWLDDNDDIKNLNLENSLFITEGNVEKKIPILKDSKYLVAYADRKKKILHKYEKKNLITLSSRQYDELENLVSDDPASTKLDEYSFLRDNNSCNIPDNKRWYCNSKATLFQPWATDLLPNEFLYFNNSKKKKIIYHIGTLHGGEHMKGFVKACKENKIRLIVKSGSNSFLKKIRFKFFFSKNKNKIFNYIYNEINDSGKLINSSYINLALQPEIQVNGAKKSYIPCRIFKNISYGRLCGTNSKYVMNLFDGNIPYSNNSYDLFYKTYNMESGYNENKFKTISKFVREKHTYLNRIKNILSVF
jgi:hypothetical protein